MRQILDAALADGLVANNAAKSVKAPTAPRRRDVHLTDNDVAALIAATRNTTALVITLVAAGLHQRSLRPKSKIVDFRRTLRVRQQRRPGGEFGQLKTDSS